MHTLNLKHFFMANISNWGVDNLPDTKFDKPVESPVLHKAASARIKRFDDQKSIDITTTVFNSKFAMCGLGFIVHS